MFFNHSRPIFRLPFHCSKLIISKFEIVACFAVCFSVLGSPPCCAMPDSDRGKAPSGFDIMPHEEFAVFAQHWSPFRIALKSLFQQRVLIPQRLVFLLQAFYFVRQHFLCPPYLVLKMSTVFFLYYSVRFVHCQYFFGGFLWHIKILYLED